MSRRVWRCTVCGTTSRDGARSAEPPRPRAKHKPPVNEGPPQNPVIDEETAARLRRALGGD